MIKIKIIILFGFFMGNSRLILAINGLIMILLELPFGLFQSFYFINVSRYEKNNEAFNVANALRKNMGAGCCFIGLLIFGAKTVLNLLLKNLYCSGWVFHTYCCFIRSKIVGRQVPLFILILFAIMALISICVASRRFQR